MSNTVEALQNTLQLRFLGAPLAEYQGHPLKFRSRKVLALLIYLVVDGGQHQREKLITMFWQDSNPKQGRMTLRSTLARLRKTLAASGTFIIAEAGRIGFDDSQDYWLDLQPLEHHAQIGTVEQLQLTLASIRGEFLEGFSLPDAPAFDDWMMLQREIWHQRIEQAFDRLSRLQAEQGQSAKAVETAVGWVAHNPFNEAAYQRLMETHLIAGNRAAALQTYDQCQRVLAEELGVLPSADLEALVDRVRHPESALDRSSLSQSPATTNALSVELPFVGRATEYQKLISAYQQLHQQESQVVTIVAESGMGKTRLCQEFMDWVMAVNPSVNIITGKTFEMGGQFPYQPVVEAFRRRLDEENAPEDLLADVWLAELSQLFPELRERYPDLPAPFGGNADLVRARIFEAVARLGEALAQSRSVVLFLDDMQWADDDSLDLLHYLTRRWQAQHVSILVIITLRQQAILMIPELQDWLNRLERDTAFLRLKLAPIDLRNITLLVSQLAGLSMPDAPIQRFSQWLYGETQGQPFFIAEMLQMLAERNLLVFQPDATSNFLNIAGTLHRMAGIENLPLPPTIRETILARLGRLSEAATALILAIAVIGREAAFEQLSHISGVDEVAALTHLETLLRTRLIVESVTPVPKYAFSHDKIREAVYSEASEARLRLYHRRALAILEADGASSAELAFHAGAAHLVEPAFRYSLDAGNTALQTYALSDALKHFTQAHTLSRQADVDPDSLLTLYHNRGRALELAHRFDDALTNYEELDAIAQQLDAPKMYLASLIGRAILFSTTTPLRDPAQGKLFSEQALALARSLADRETETRALWSMLLVHHYGSGNEESARDYGEAALLIARELDLNEMIAYILNDLNWVYITLGDFRQAQRCLTEAIERWESIGNISMLLDSLNGAGILYTMIGDFELAMSTADRGIQLANAVGNIWNQIAMHANLLWVYREQARYHEIIPILQKAIDFAQDAMPNIAFYYQGSLAIIYSDIGAIDLATQLCDHILQHCDATPAFWQLENLVYAIQARLYLIQGDLPQARTALERTTLAPGEIGIAHASLMIPLLRCELALAETDYAKAIDDADQWIGLLENSGVVLGLADAYLYKGQALLAESRFVEARQALYAARDIASTLQKQRIVWEILTTLAAIEEALTNPSIARDLRRDACSTLKRIVDTIPEGKLRNSFLALPTVKTVIRVNDCNHATFHQQSS